MQLLNSKKIYFQNLYVQCFKIEDKHMKVIFIVKERLANIKCLLYQGIFYNIQNFSSFIFIKRIFQNKTIILRNQFFLIFLFEKNHHMRFLVTETLRVTANCRRKKIFRDNHVSQERGKDQKNFSHSFTRHIQNLSLLLFNS